MMKKLIAGFGLVAASAASYAYDYDRWMCDWCELRPIGTPTAGMDIGLVIQFIKSENPSILRTNDADRWRPNDVITVCDGNICLTVVYHASGTWLPVGGTYKDKGKGYKNVKAKVKKGVVGANENVDFTLEYRILAVDYSGAVSYQYTRVVTITTTPPVPRSGPAPFGEGFGTGFEWGSGATNSDSWAQTCRFNCGTYTQLSVPKGNERTPN